MGWRCLSKYPVNMPDPTRKRLGYGKLWPLRPVCSQNRPGSYIPDPTSCIHFSSGCCCFQRRPGSHCVKPTRIRSGWPGRRLAKHIWSGSNLVCMNHRTLFLAGRNRARYQFSPLSDSVPFFHRRPRIILCKTGPDPI